MLGKTPIDNLFINDSTGIATENRNFYSYVGIDISDITTDGNLYGYVSKDAAGNWEIFRSVCFYDASGTFLAGYYRNNKTFPIPDNATTVSVTIAHGAGINGMAVKAYLSTSQNNNLFLNEIGEIEINIDQTNKSLIALYDRDGKYKKQELTWRIGLTFNHDTGVPTTNSACAIVGDYIPVETGEYIHILGSDDFLEPMTVYIHQYDSAYSWIMQTSLKLNGTKINYTGLSSECAYIRLACEHDSYRKNMTDSNLEKFSIYTETTDLTDTQRINNISVARRGIISFVLDHDYDRNDLIIKRFNAKGIKISVALRYPVFFSSNSKEYYDEFVKNGNEVLVHGGYDMSPKTTYTDEEIAHFIKDSHSLISEYGYDVHGFIALAGNMQEKYLPYVKRYYDFAASVNNHSGSYIDRYPDLVEPCLYFKVDSPFKLWRYSLQTSTLEQMKSAVDRAIETTGFLWFYGHAETSNIGNFTEQNVNALCDYINAKGTDIVVKLPTDAVKDYYTVRHEDVYG